MNNMKTAIITGCPGQDAYYLINLLLEKNYKVIGTYRYSSTNFERRFEGYPPTNQNLQYICCDITDPSGVNLLVNRFKPDEIYNLAAASHVGESFKNPTSVFNINCGAVINWLEAIRNISPNTKFYQASTSELFGSNFLENVYPHYGSGRIKEKFQDESTPFSPNSPYAAAKLAAHNMVRIYRDSYNIFACAGILFNHESERRGENFVTRKITKWIGEFIRWKNNIDDDFGYYRIGDDYIGFCELKTNVSKNKFPRLRLGNVDAVRDWSHAKDMVYGMWLMLQQEKPDDFVLASGKGYSVRDFLQEAFSYIGIKDYNNYWVIDSEFFRPCEVEYLQGCANKAKNILGWEPKINFKELVKLMVENDLFLLRERCEIG